MAGTSIYQDIAKRTGGDIYIGVVGPVRTGKSTFIKKFMEELVLPNIEDEDARARARDELPQSASGKTVMTAEPKFIPESAAQLRTADGMKMRVKLVDCVGYLVDGALGAEEDGSPRMVNTPWGRGENGIFRRCAAWDGKGHAGAFHRRRRRDDRRHHRRDSA